MHRRFEKRQFAAMRLRKAAAWEMQHGWPQRSKGSEMFAMRRLTHVDWDGVASRIPRVERERDRKGWYGNVRADGWNLAGMCKAAFVEWYAGKPQNHDTICETHTSARPTIGDYSPAGHVCPAEKQTAPSCNEIKKPSAGICRLLHGSIPHFNLT